MNQGKKRRSGPLELIIHARVSSLMVSNQLLHKVYTYNCKDNCKDKYTNAIISIKAKYTEKIFLHNSCKNVLIDGQITFYVQSALMQCQDKNKYKLNENQSKIQIQQILCWSVLTYGQ